MRDIPRNRSVPSTLDTRSSRPYDARLSRNPCFLLLCRVTVTYVTTTTTTLLHYYYRCRYCHVLVARVHSRERKSNDVAVVHPWMLLTKTSTCQFVRPSNEQITGQDASLGRRLASTSPALSPGRRGSGYSLFETRIDASWEPRRRASSTVARSHNNPRTPLSALPSSTSAVVRIGCFISTPPWWVLARPTQPSGFRGGTMFRMENAKVRWASTALIFIRPRCSHIYNIYNIVYIIWYDIIYVVQKIRYIWSYKHVI